MSYEFEVDFNGEQAEVGGFGFEGAFTHRIMLGELPSIPFDQFAKFGTETLIALFPLLNNTEQKQICEYLQFVLNRTKEKFIRPTPKTPLQLPHIIPMEVTAHQEIPGESIHASIMDIRIDPDIFQQMDAAKQRGDYQEYARLNEEFSISLDVARGTRIEPRTSNPFSISLDGTIDIEDVYSGIDPKKFANFVLYGLCGGFLGWSDESGIPQSAHEGLKDLELHLLN